MKLKALVAHLPLQMINQASLDREVQGVYIGDLLSFVMANGEEHNLWLTIQRHVNVVAVASLSGFSGIVFVQDIDPEADTLAKANEHDIPLLKTTLTAYELAKLLGNAGV